MTCLKDFLQFEELMNSFRAVGRCENPGVPVLFGGHNQPSLVEIGLTDLPKSAPPAPRGPTPPVLSVQAERYRKKEGAHLHALKISYFKRQMLVMAVKLW